MKTAYLFPGQGAQFVGMAEEFYREFDIVRELFDMAEEITRINLARLCFKGPLEDLTQTVHLQPAMTVANLASLAVIEKEAGAVDARICAGHSLGEFSALCAAGIVSREDTMQLVLKRGELMHREAGKHEGVMQAIVGLDIETVNELVAAGQKTGVVSVANHNTAKQVVVTGQPQAVNRVAAAAANRGAKAVPLKVSGAWHSELIRGAEKAFSEFLSAVAFEKPRRSVIFNVTADSCEDPDEIRGIMARQLCSPVRWHDSMLQMNESGVERYIELGPGRVLTGLLRKTLPGDAEVKFYNLSNLKQLESILKGI